MYKRVYDFLPENNIIYDLQIGFRQKFSTSHASINLTENIRQALDEGYIGCSIFVALQKTFDTVDHEILLSKLDYYSIQGISNKGSSIYDIHQKNDQFFDPPTPSIHKNEQHIYCLKIIESTNT